MRASIIIGIFTLLLSTAVCAEMILIANKNLPVNEISREDAAKIFLGKKKRWENGNKIDAVILKSGPAHDEFLEQIVKKDRGQFETYWKRMVFTGQGQALKSFDSEAQLVEYISQNPDTIGYIDSGTPHADVKTVKVK